jgi:hypothetical protein
MQPSSDMADMKAMLEGETTARDDFIQTEAVATALAYLTLYALHEGAAKDAAGRNGQTSAFAVSFKLAQLCDPVTLAGEYVQACNHLSRRDA